MLVYCCLVVGDAVALALSELKKFTRVISAYIIQEVHSALKQIHNFKYKYSNRSRHLLGWRSLK